MSPEPVNTNDPGQPIDTATATLMMQLYQARIKAVAAVCPDLGINPADEPQLLFFKLSNLNDLINALNNGPGHIAACLGLTVLDSFGKPGIPTSAELVIMQELVDLQALGNYTEYKAKIQTINLAQTVIIAGCDNEGNVILDEPGVFCYYDMGGTCCN